MSVIVHQKKSRAVVLDFEAPSRVLKLCERFRDFFKRVAELLCQIDESQRVVNVMLSGAIQRCFVEILSSMIDPERRTKVLQPDIRSAIIGRLAKTIGNSARERSE